MQVCIKWVPRGTIVELISQNVKTGEFIKVGDHAPTGFIHGRSRFTGELKRYHPETSVEEVDADTERRLCDKNDMGGFTK